MSDQGKPARGIGFWHAVRVGFGAALGVMLAILLVSLLLGAIASVLIRWPGVGIDTLIGGADVLRTTPVVTHPASAAPTSTPTVSGPSTARATGTGTATDTVSLSEGLWLVEVRMSGNRDGGRATNFIMRLEGVAGGSALLVNDIATSWDGGGTVRVGPGFLADVQPGRVIVSVDAAADATWSATFKRQ